MAKLLLVEDDESLRTGLRYTLEDEGYEVVEAPDAASALEAFDRDPADLVLLDLRLPDRSGFEVCRELRRTSFVPIVIVTAQDDTHDLVAGLEAGADDYVTKPVTAKALAARVRAHLRRAAWQGAPAPGGGGLDAELLAQVDLEIRESEAVVLRHGRPVPLTKTELRLLCEFARHPNQLLSRDQLLESVWGYEYVGDGRLVDTHVRRLRGKIEDEPDQPTLIVTARGLGYRLVVDRVG